MGSKGFFSNFLAVFALVLASCANDKTSDAYQSDKLQEDFAKLKVAEGTYAGFLNSSVSGERLGVLEVDLTAATQKKSASSEGKGESAVLITSLRFIGSDVFSISVGDAYFDVRTKVFQANISVNRRGGGEQQLSLSGSIVGDVFSGNLNVVGYSKFGSAFSLRRNSTSADELAQAETFPDVSYSKEFLALNQFFPSQAVTPLAFRIIQNNFSNAEKFVDFLMPQKIVQVSLSFGESLTMSFDNAVWDQRTESLTGSAKLTNGNRIDLSCRSTGLSTNPSSWICQQGTNEAALVARLQTYETAEFEKRFKDDIADRSAEKRESYKGEAHYGPKTTQATLEVVYATRSRAEQISDFYFPSQSFRVSATLTLFGEPGSSRVPILFPAENTVWDAPSRKLQGIRNEFRSGESFQFSLNCNDFDFFRRRGPFTCVYTSNYAPNPFYLNLN